jgi:serine/threonine protein phosphatase PrpC
MLLMQGDVPRVNGQLAVSRAFGDRSLKSHLRSDPDVQTTDIDVDTEILILASDGVWKVKYSYFFISWLLILMLNIKGKLFACDKLGNV